MRTFAAVSLLLALAAAGFAADTEPPLDWEAMRALRQRELAGQPLSDAERAELDRGKRALDRGESPGQPGRPVGAAEPAARPGAGNGTLDATAAGVLRGAQTGLVPLTDLGTGTYRGRRGGLYDEGRNEPTSAMREQERRLLATIVPRDPLGRPATPAAGGRIGLLSIGMSNCTEEFRAFMAAVATGPAVAPGVVLVDGAQGSRDAASWGALNDAEPWAELDRRLAAAAIAAPQIQAVWLKTALRLPQEYGRWPYHLQAFKAELMVQVGKLRARFPNLAVIHCSSRTYGGYWTRSLGNPEPYAYEGSFAIRELILDQAAGEPALNPDPERGPVAAPVLRWGPYLWADGVRPRGDGLTWQREDFIADGIHPGPSGEAKVVALLQRFYRDDPSTAWFRAGPSSGP